MTPFSASDAALEGFHLIRRSWRAILGWAGFNLLALIMVVVLSAVLSVIAAAVGGGTSTPVLAFAGFAGGLATLFSQAIIVGGVFRLELRPAEPAFLHLRLGRDELRLVVVWLITLTGVWVVGWAATLLGQLIGGGGVLVELLGAALAVYLGLRFLLAAPVAFVERRIDFVRSWRLTRGRVWALLGMSALSICLIALLMIVVFVVLAAIATAAAGLDGLAVLFAGTEALQQHPAVFLLAFAVEIILIPVLWVLGIAPLVAAYRAFTADGDAAPVNLKPETGGSAA
ncbi:hypothetical protein LJR219_002072 [Phenylobacterium sp. LjRoot219]|uniref:hypothetical protein n=1 Tax=Phenylobacterium sp. LjRoot219 TaxID=3342283 RepID=UPI003ECC50A3